MVDKQAPLVRIPTPFSTIWREVRIRVIPLVTFVGVGIACYYLWGQMGRGSSVPGVGEGVRSTVASPYVGILQQVYVEPFQWVEQGQPLARIAPTDPQAKLDLLQSELQLTRIRLEPSQSDQNAMNYERLRIEWLSLKTELAMAQANLVRAESQFQMNDALIKDKLVSREIYAISLGDRNVYQAEITTKSNAIVEIESRMKQLRSLGEPQSPGTNPNTIELIARLESRLAAAETNWSPITLTAPISGMVQVIYRHSAEYVVEGEPLMTINSGRSERVIAYLRQPYPLDPEVGMEAEILTRTRKPQRFMSKISEIGAQIEMITNSLAFIKQGSMVDEGLPVVFPVPMDAHIRPGEIVDVILKPIGFLPKPDENPRQTANIPKSPEVRYDFAGRITNRSSAIGETNSFQ
jgi:multidrug resistance efflux pump